MTNFCLKLIYASTLETKVQSTSCKDAKQLISEITENLCSNAFMATAAAVMTAAAQLLTGYLGQKWFVLNGLHNADCP